MFGTYLRITFCPGCWAIVVGVMYSEEEEDTREKTRLWKKHGPVKVEETFDEIQGCL
jgi:hypothetical protein